ncbi:AbiJ-NTD4 domain-containing protein [Acinetobacter sp. TY2]|uniref:AbiJ-NTD4 domain-containing protein n=1 Tax=Acinetobacter sp. TY2 TaxID=3387403 RepID=UPI003917931D
MNYSQRIHGNKIRINENINFTFWKKLTQIFEEMYKNDYFSKKYPIILPWFEEDSYYGSTIEMFYAGSTYKCNSKELSDDLAFHIGDEFGWPLKTQKMLSPKVLNGYQLSTKFENWMPSIDQVFDLIEFFYSRTHSVKVESINYEGDLGEFEKFNILSFPEGDNSAKEDFSEKVNTLLRDARIIYEFDSHAGQIKTIISAETKQLINNALNNKLFYHDAIYQEMLQNACNEISSCRRKESYEALKKLWDAYERLKCYFDPKTQIEKKDSSQKIVDLFSETPIFQIEVSEEMFKLSKLGNKLTIRHSETYQEDLRDSRQINYLFNRCLAMIVLIQDQIVATNKTKKFI